MASVKKKSFVSQIVRIFANCISMRYGMSKRWFIALLLLPALHVGAQGIRLTRYDAPNALYLYADHLYNYNMYERSRIELAMAWITPNENAATRRQVVGQWSLRPYIAYSTGDRALKYGLATQLRLKGVRNVRLWLWASNDLERAASRRMEGYHLLEPSLNDGLVSSRFVGVKGGGMGVKLPPRYGMELTMGVRQTWEDYRFDSSSLLYPNREEERRAEVRPFTEIQGRWRWDHIGNGHSSTTVELCAGRAAGNEVDHYWRALAQYDGNLLGEEQPAVQTFRPVGLHLFAQVGFASAEAPYCRMFDLSGTANAPYYFRNTFLTVRPNSFTANLFAHLCLNYTAPLPLRELSWSAPRPFLQLNAMWGHLLQQDATGQRLWEGLPLQSPNKGLLEPATGFVGLIHWGLTDIGMGVAYQLCPASAPYWSEDIDDKIAFLIVADLILK